MPPAAGVAGYRSRPLQALAHGDRLVPVVLELLAHLPEGAAGPEADEAACQAKCGTAWTVSTASRVRVTRLPHTSSNSETRYLHSAE